MMGGRGPIVDDRVDPLTVQRQAFGCVEDALREDERIVRRAFTMDMSCGVDVIECNAGIVDSHVDGVEALNIDSAQVDDGSAIQINFVMRTAIAVDAFHVGKLLAFDPDGIIYRGAEDRLDADEFREFDEGRS